MSYISVIIQFEYQNSLVYSILVHLEDEHVIYSCVFAFFFTG